MNRGCSGAFLLLIVGCAAMSQQNRPAWTGPDDPFARLDLYVEHEDAQNRRGELESLPDSVSKLDLKAPGKARREYEKGLELLIRKNYAGAFEHLTRSVSIYPKFVAAHNALGSAYMDEGQNEHAREEFTHAVLLDDHLPNSYLNLGRSELALKRYPAAQESIQRASSIEPLNLQILTALTYAQFLNHDYGAAIATAHQVHARKHDRAAMVHYFAAAALEEQNSLQESQRELETLLKEDPNSPSAGLARQMMAQIQERENQPVPTVTISFVPSPGEVPLAPGEMAPRDRKLLQDFQEQKQVAEAECETCDALRSPIAVAADVSPGASSGVQPFSSNHSGWTLHSTVDEVPVFFAAQTMENQSPTSASEKSGSATMEVLRRQ
jgi:tetratricopeptide (TPR) repeat protein